MGKDSTKTQEIIEMLGGVKFGQDADGNWGYIPPGGADSVIPFKRGSGSSEGGGIIGCEIIKRFGWGTASGAGTFSYSCSAELEKDYKCFFALLGCYVPKNTSYKYTVTPSFREGSIVLMSPSAYPSNSLNAYNILAIAADLNQDGLKTGDTYNFSFSVYASATPARYPFAMLCGFY